MVCSGATPVHGPMIMVVRLASGLGFDHALGSAFEDPGRGHDGWLGRLKNSVLPESPPGGSEGVAAARAGIVAGCLPCLPTLERGAEHFPLGLQVADPGGHLTDFLAWCRVGLLVVGVAEGC